MPPRRILSHVDAKPAYEPINLVPPSAFGSMAAINREYSSDRDVLSQIMVQLIRTDEYFFDAISRASVASRP